MIADRRRSLRIPLYCEKTVHRLDTIKNQPDGRFRYWLPKGHPLSLRGESDQIHPLVRRLHLHRFDCEKHTNDR